MDWISHFVRRLRGSQGFVRACLLLLILAAAAVATPAAASPDEESSSRQRDELRLPEDYLFPRNAVVQAAIAPRPTRPKDLGGPNPKLVATASIVVTRARLLRALEIRLDAPTPITPHRWTWTSRAPPFVEA